jgi:asparagine synthase (glutamine-hydrolysing)
MSNETEDVWVVFNGEIYNHADLRPGLQAKGHHYRTRCDTETIVHLYEEQGDAAVEQLRGMFAFAVWDRSRQRLLLARDRLGIKPLYYRVSDRELLFASEIKAILAADGERAEFNEAVLPEFLSTRFVSGEETFFRGVRKLLPGTCCRGRPARRRGLAATGSCRPGAAIGAGSRAPDLRERLETAVASHLMSDVPLGVFLSGGIDSSALAALAARATRDPLQTFAVGFAEAEANELPYARMVADHIGAEHREVTVTPTRSSTRSAGGVARRRADGVHVERAAVRVGAPGAPARQGRADGRGRRRAVPRLQPLSRDALESRLGQPYWAAMPGAARRAVRDAVRTLPAPLARVARRTFVGLEPGLRGVYHENFAVFPLSAQQRLVSAATARRLRPLRDASGLLRRGGGRTARSDRARRAAVVPARAPDETGPDEHGGVDRKPRAVPRRPPCGARGRHARAR